MRVCGGGGVGVGGGGGGLLTGWGISSLHCLHLAGFGD